MTWNVCIRIRMNMNDDVRLDTALLWCLCCMSHLFSESSFRFLRFCLQAGCAVVSVLSLLFGMGSLQRILSCCWMLFQVALRGSWVKLEAKESFQINVLMRFGNLNHALAMLLSKSIIVCCSCGAEWDFSVVVDAANEVVKWKILAAMLEEGRIRSAVSIL